MSQMLHNIIQNWGKSNKEIDHNGTECETPIL